MRRSSLRRANFGLAVAAVGLLIVVAGLRSAVAGGGACSATSDVLKPEGLPFWCSGDCPAGGSCSQCCRPDASGNGLVWECGCADDQGNEMYVPIEAPQCSLGMRGTDRYALFTCIRNGCPHPCGEARCEGWPVRVRDQWSCACDE